MRIKIFYLFIFLSITANTAIAQKKKKSARSSKEIKRADELFEDNKNYIEAVKIYSEVGNEDTLNLYANYMAGKINLMIDQKSKALKYLLRVFKVNDKYRADLIYLLADAHRYKYKFEKAIKFFEQYQEMLNMSQLTNIEGDIIPPERINKSIRECKFAQANLRKPKPYQLENLGSNVNSSYPDYSPTLNLDESILIYTSRRLEDNTSDKLADDGLPYEDIYISKKDSDNKWIKATNMGKRINTPLHDSNISISTANDLLYLYGEDNNGDIYSTQLTGNKDDDRKVIRLPDPVNTDYKEHSFVEAPDGSFAVLSSDRPSGLGGLDLYILEKEGQEWSRIKNIGVEINTSYNEISPFIHPNGILYFASQGHQNMGGYDIFESKYDPINKLWGKPRNLGYPINTPNDDVRFVVSLDGSTVYLSSVRNTGMGYTDIYKVTGFDLNEKKPEKRTPVSANNVAQVEPEPQTEDPSTESAVIQKPLDKDKIILRIILTDAETNENLASDNVQIRHIATGNIQLSKPSEDTSVAVFGFNNSKKEEYIMTAQAENYTFRSFIVTVPKSTSEQRIITQKVPLKKIKDGQKQVLTNVYFKTGSEELLPTSYLILNKLREMLENEPGIKMEIIGHTDKLGSDKLNLVLSEKRANSVVQYLVDQGINGGRLVSIGLGNQDPLASNDDEEDGRELNRRVEFKIINKNL